MQLPHFSRHSKIAIVEEFEFKTKNTHENLYYSIGVAEDGNKYFIVYSINIDTIIELFKHTFKLNGLIGNTINVPKLFDIDEQLSCVYFQFIEGILASDLFPTLEPKERVSSVRAILSEWKKFSTLDYGGFPKYDYSNLELLLFFSGIKSISICGFFKHIVADLRELPQSVLHADFNSTNIIFHRGPSLYRKEVIYFIDYLNMSAGPRLVDFCSFLIDPQANLSKEETDFAINIIVAENSISSDELQLTLFYEAIRKLLILKLIGQKHNDKVFVSHSNWISERIKSNFYDFSNVISLSNLNNFFDELHKAS